MNSTVQTLISALQDEREGLRLFAVRRLVSFQVLSVPSLIEALADGKEYTQESAAIGLATIGAPSVPYLLAALKSPERRTRWGAAWVLASMGPEAHSAIPQVRLPAAQSATNGRASDSGIHRGVWSDSWLTKIRRQLDDARGRDLIV